MTMKLRRNNLKITLAVSLFAGLVGLSTLAAAAQDNNDKPHPNRAQSTTSQPAPQAPHAPPQQAQHTAPPPRQQAPVGNPVPNNPPLSVPRTSAGFGQNRPNNPAPVNNQAPQNRTVDNNRPATSNQGQRFPNPGYGNNGAGQNPAPGQNRNIPENTYHPAPGGNPGQHPSPGDNRSFPQQNQQNRSPQNSANPFHGGTQRVARDGSAIRMAPNGRVTDVHDAHRGLDIHQGLNGSRQISVRRPDHSITVFQRGRPGFVQRPYSFRGSSFARRTYVFQGRSYDRFYRGFGFRGLFLSVYAPSFYFGPGYYGWAYNPWGHSIRYNWGWAGNPWFGYYGYYFQPYATYPSAAYWLTDYMISANLQAAYAAQQDGGEMDGGAGDGAAPLSPDVKQMIADEVQKDLALENMEAISNSQGQSADPGSSGIARILSDVANGHQHVFVAAGSLDVADNSGAQCSLSDGDVLLLDAAPPPDATSAQLIVLASKGGQECRKSDTVSVPLDALQEMQNQMRATIDQGLQTLQANQGQNGVPAAPVAPQVTPAVYTTVAPPPDPNAAAQIQQTAQQGAQAQADVTADVNQSGAAPVPAPADPNAQPQPDASGTVWQSSGTPAAPPTDPNAATPPQPAPNAAPPQAGTAPAAPPTVTLGQSIGDVEGILGQPTTKAVLGNKTVYNYSGMKVIFINGAVTDVQ